jgi:hypothetical protein
MSKYHSQKIAVNGVKYDSRKEYRRHQELRLLEQAGAISNLRCQVKFVLIPSQYMEVPDQRTGQTRQKCVERECSYIADFCYIQNGKQIVEDVKGVRTKDYIIKRKLMLYMHGIRLKET